MRTRHWLVGGILLAVLFTLTAPGEGQPPASGTPKAEPRDPPPAVDPPARAPLASPRPIDGLVLPPKVDRPAIATPSVPPPLPPAPPMMDQLIDRLTDIRARKAALEKEEQATIAAIQEKMRAQRERLNKLGVGDPPGLEMR